MKILMTIDTVGGVWTYALELARALEPHGVRIALATMGAPLTADQRAEAGESANVEVYESRYRLEWMQEAWEDVDAAGEWLLQLERAFGPDVVHLNGYCHGALRCNAPVLMVGHSCVCSWHRAVRGREAGADWDEYRRRVADGLHAAAMVVAPTRWMLAALDEHYGARGRRRDGETEGRREWETERARGEEQGWRVIPNGRDARLYRRHTMKQPVVLAVGRLWDEGKNIGTLARAAGRIEWRVQVAGDAGHPDGGRTEFENVDCLGRLSAAGVAEHMAEAAIYALPAWYEPFGLSPLEAALSGCALVLGDIPSLREVWRDAATFVPPGDADALTAAINGLIADPDRREERAAAAYARAARYSPEAMAEAYMAAYEEVVRERGLRKASDPATPRVFDGLCAGAAAR